MAFSRRSPRHGQNRANRWLSLLALAALLIGLQWLQQHRREAGVPADPIVERARLVDGDSFHLGADEVRLVGTDAPEGRQTCMRDGAEWPCGEEARRQLARLIGGRAVSCRARERDQHGRLLAVCTVGGTELNREMVASGMAVAYGSYEREEAQARAAGRGLWAGQFERPRTWRSKQREVRD